MDVFYIAFISDINIKTCAAIPHYLDKDKFEKYFKFVWKNKISNVQLIENSEIKKLGYSFDYDEVSLYSCITKTKFLKEKHILFINKDLYNQFRKVLNIEDSYEELYNKTILKEIIF